MRHPRSSRSGKSGAVALVALFALVAVRAHAEDETAARAVEKVAAGAVAVRKERKKVQEIDLKRLEIQGRIEDPASVFVLETGRLLLPGLDILQGILPGERLEPVAKDALDHEVVLRIEGEMGVAKR